MGDVIDRMLNKLPRNGVAKRVKEDTRVMTVRMPAQLHAELLEEARSRNTSANKLAVAKIAIKGETLDKVLEMEHKTENA